MNYNRLTTIFFTLFSTLLIVISCSPDQTIANNTKDEVVFMAGFKAQANLPFAAVYVAQEMGYFTEENLDVEIRHSASGGTLSLLASKTIDITTSDAANLVKFVSDQDIPLTSFALIGQVGQQSFVSLEKSNINSPKDWEGKVLGYKGSPPPEYLAILKANQVDRSKIDEVRVGYNPAVLTNGDVDILAVFRSNEPNIIESKLGYPVTIWSPFDYDLPVLGLNYVTHQDTLNEDSESITKFLRAVVRALYFIVDNEDQSIEMIMKYAQNEDKSHQIYMLRSEIKDAWSTITKENGLGWMSDNQWNSFYKYLNEWGALGKDIDINKVYTTSILEEVYSDSSNKLDLKR